MIYVKVNDETSIVEFIHYKPFDPTYGLKKTQEELEQEGFFVESIPEPNEEGRKIGILHANKETKELWYEYVDRPLTPEEKLQLIEQENQDLKNRIDLMQQALDELLLGGM
jgi:hypothetical protein